MFHEKLWHAVCQVIEDDVHMSVVDVLFKEDCVPQLIPPFSVNVLKFCCVRVEDIHTQITLTDLRLYKEMVLVVWECDSMIDITSQNPKIENESLPPLNSTDVDSDDSEPPLSSSEMARSHTVVFKCIGAVRDTQSQRASYQA